MQTIHAVNTVNKNLTTVTGKAVKKARLITFNELLLKYKNSETVKLQTKKRKIDAVNEIPGKAKKVVKRKNFHNNDFAINGFFIKVHADMVRKRDGKIIKRIEITAGKKVKTKNRVHNPETEGKPSSGIVSAGIVSNSTLNKKQTAGKLSIKTKAVDNSIEDKSRKKIFAKNKSTLQLKIIDKTKNTRKPLNIAAAERIGVKTKINTFKNSLYTDSSKYTSDKKIEQAKQNGIDNKNGSIILKYGRMPSSKNRIIHKIKTNIDNGEIIKHAIKNRLNINFNDAALKTDIKERNTRIVN